MLPKGYTIERKGKGKHLYLIGPDGETVRDTDSGMPVTFSSTPGGNWEDKVQRDIQKALK